MLAVMIGAVISLPPAVLALVARELQLPFTLVPVGADLPAILHAVDERTTEQWHMVDWLQLPQIALWPAQDVPRQPGGVAHGHVGCAGPTGGVGMAMHHPDDFAQVFSIGIGLRRDAELFVRLGGGVLAGDIPVTA